MSRQEHRSDRIERGFEFGRAIAFSENANCVRGKTAAKTYAERCYANRIFNDKKELVVLIQIIPLARQSEGPTIEGKGKRILLATEIIRFGLEEEEITPIFESPSHACSLWNHRSRTGCLGCRRFRPKSNSPRFRNHFRQSKGRAATTVGSNGLPCSYAGIAQLPKNGNLF